MGIFRKRTALNDHYDPICYVGNELLAYKKEKIYLIEINSYHPREVCSLKIEDVRRPFCFCRLGERLAHISVYCGIAVDDGAVIAFNRGIYYIDCKRKKIKREHDFVLSDMRRPLNFFKIENIKGFDEMVLCPEYSGNAARRSISIYRRRDDHKWEAVFTFPKKTIRHIHAVIGDPYRDRVIILTGDDGDECAIWEARDNFRKVKKIVGSSQKYRACCAKAYPEGILIITDAPYDQNYIYLLDEKTGRTKIVRKVPGPVVFYTAYKDDLIFSTTVECAEKHHFKYFTYKRGEGIKDGLVRLYKGNLYDGFEELIRLPKDPLPMPAFGFGSIQFPNGETDGKLLYFPTAVYGSGKLRVYYL